MLLWYIQEYEKGFEILNVLFDCLHR